MNVTPPAMFGAIIDHLEFSRNPAQLKSDSNATLPGLVRPRL